MEVRTTGYKRSRSIMLAHSTVGSIYESQKHLMRSGGTRAFYTHLSASMTVHLDINECVILDGCFTKVSSHNLKRRYHIDSPLSTLFPRQRLIIARYYVARKRSVHVNSTHFIRNAYGHSFCRNEVLTQNQFLRNQALACGSWYFLRCKYLLYLFSWMSTYSKLNYSCCTLV